MCFGLSRSDETEFTEHETGPGFPCNGSTPIAGAGDRSLAGVDSSNDIREFLATPRARITPQQAGPATYRGRPPGPPPRPAGSARPSPGPVGSSTPPARGDLAAASPT